MQAPKAPATPDPYRVAAAQQAINISTAIASTVLDNANEDTPEAITTTVQDGSYSIDDPQYNSTGALVGTTTRVIPIFKRTVTLKTSSQQIFDVQQALQLAMLQLANAQTGGMTTLLGTPFSLTGLPAAGASPSAPTLQQALEDAGAVPTTIDDTDALTAKQAVIDAINDRLQWQIDLDRAAKITALANQGIFPGMRAYERAMKEFDLASNDARKQALLVGGQEHSRLFAIAAHKAEFARTSQAQKFSQAVIKLQNYNGVQTQQFQVLRAVADFANTARERALQEALTVRNTAVNETTTILRGGQMQLPTLTPFRGATVDSTPLGQYVYNSAAIDMQKYQANVERQNAMIGGIAGIVGGAAMLPVAGGGSLGGNLIQQFMR